MGDFKCGHMKGGKEKLEARRAWRPGTGVEGMICLSAGRRLSPSEQWLKPRWICIGHDVSM